MRIGAWALVSAAVPAGAGCSKEPENQQIVRPAYAVQVGADADRSGSSFPGRARAHREADLSFGVAGPLIELPNDVVGRAYELKLRDVEGRLERARSAVKPAQVYMPPAMVRVRKYGVRSFAGWKFEARFSGPAETDPDVLRDLGEQG